MAAYLAMLTGLGVSVTIAAIIKTSLVTLCVVILLWLLTTALVRLNCKRLKRFASVDCQSDIIQKHHQTGEEENIMTSLKGKNALVIGASSPQGQRCFARGRNVVTRRSSRIDRGW
jgi:hypothetical protein